MALLVDELRAKSETGQAERGRRADAWAQEQLTYLAERARAMAALGRQVVSISCVPPSGFTMADESTLKESVRTLEKETGLLLTLSLVASHAEGLPLHQCKIVSAVLEARW